MHVARPLSQVDSKLSGITKQRMMDDGIGMDLLSLARPPLHIVPLFICRDKFNTERCTFLFPLWKCGFSVWHSPSTNSQSAHNISIVCSEPPLIPAHSATHHSNFPIQLEIARPLKCLTGCISPTLVPKASLQRITLFHL